MANRKAVLKGRGFQPIFLMKIKAIIWQEDDLGCGSVPALPGSHTWGESYEQLLEMLEDAVQGWLEVASQQNELAPEKQLIELSL